MNRHAPPAIVKKLPMIILLISSGSRWLRLHHFQKAATATSIEKLRIASSVISQLLGSVVPMRTNPKFFAKRPEELMGAAALMAKTIDGKMPSLFTRLPRLPYGVKPIPLETAEGNTTAYYVQGSPDAGIAGTYFVNTTHLDQRPLWELPALTVHEAVPGHHMNFSSSW